MTILKEIVITNTILNGSAFAMVRGTMEGVYIPPAVAEVAGIGDRIRIGDVTVGKLVSNPRDRDGSTPLKCNFIDINGVLTKQARGEDPAPEKIREADDVELSDDEVDVLMFLRAKGRPMRMDDIRKALWDENDVAVPRSSVRKLLKRLAGFGKISEAVIHRRANQTRASAVFYSADGDDMIRRMER